MPRPVLTRACCLAVLITACGGQSTAAPVVSAVNANDVRPAPVVVAAADAHALWNDAHEILNARCVVCHGCYDAPCQLKLGGTEGIRRGATDAAVYDPSRLTAAKPTRLGIDAQDVAMWRGLGFHSVIPEGDEQSPEASALVRMLELKRLHPMPEGDLSDTFTFALDHKQACSNADKFSDFEESHPFWGMPYGLPALSALEHQKVLAWVAAGAPMFDEPEPSTALQQEIDRWEAFFNGATAKEKLTARYLYEHLFVMSLVLGEGDNERAFRLVRSRTRPGEPLDVIATRRPFDDPGTEAFYYRLAPQLEPRLTKTYMPYALNAQRLAFYRRTFVEPEYEVTELPSYARQSASNPLLTFAAIPINLRYRFLLEEAQLTLMAFIKGPVCRGQVALNVIQDRFWVMFVDPDSRWSEEIEKAVVEVAPVMALPAEAGSETLALEWFALAKQHDRYVARKNTALKRIGNGSPGITAEMIWDGDGNNRNAALTVLRHFDSATVVQGLVGGPSKTTWVIDYPMLERIHYLLVAGFDVFGNVGHQVATRMYMDFLRMEGEQNFLAMLPIKRRGALVSKWYRGLERQARLRVEYTLASFSQEPAIRYRSAQPEQELLALLQARVAAVRDHRYDPAQVDAPIVRAAMERLSALAPKAATRWPEISFVSVVMPDASLMHFTVLRDSAHTNLSELLREDARRVPEEDRLTVLRGFVGAYPNALFKVPAASLDVFVNVASMVDSEEAASQLHRDFGVRRVSAEFWEHSDAIHAAYRRLEPNEAGLFDYSQVLPN